MLFRSRQRLAPAPRLERCGGPVSAHLYPYATTSPIYLELPARRPAAIADATYFAAWLERVVTATEARDDFNDERERTATLDYLRSAQQRYRALAEP